MADKGKTPMGVVAFFRWALRGEEGFDPTKQNYIVTLVPAVEADWLETTLRNEVSKAAVLYRLATEPTYDRFVSSVDDGLKLAIDCCIDEALRAGKLLILSPIPVNIDQL